MIIKLLFSTTVFLSAFLLFWLELFFAKLLLPNFGGGSAIWTSCLACFQLLLLLGYLYVHWANQRKKLTRRLTHLVLIILSLWDLPIHLKPWDFVGHPSLQIIGTILASIGSPLVVLAMSSSMLQGWFATPDRKPYFLYGMSNMGSLAALIAYPFAIEPTFTLSFQSIAWSLLFVLFLGLMEACRIVSRNNQASAKVTHQSAPNHLRIQWLWFSFVPSSLLAGITTYTTSDIAPSPIVWAIFLGLYLTTFILVFLPSPFLFPAEVKPIILMMVILSLGLYYMSGSRISPQLLSLNIVIFLGVIWSFHSELARLRPPAAQLAEFYVFVALGGCLGGLFNALVAPLIFPRLIEYPLMLAISAAWLRLPNEWAKSWFNPLCRVQALPAFRYSISICLAMLVVIPRPEPNFNVTTVVRSFYGAYQVGQTPTVRILLHGSTIHGEQKLDKSLSQVPGSYYSSGSPIDDVLQTISDRAHVAVVGLGAGEVASHSKPQQNWTFYELDPLIVEIARSSFTYLSEMQANHRIVTGDGRLELDKSPEQYDLIVLDAFSSDAVPMHLLTIEALKLFQSKLKPNGTIAYNITNGYIDLEKPLAQLASSSGLFGMMRQDRRDFGNQVEVGSPSDWVVLTSNRNQVATLKQHKWRDLQRGAMAVWRDDFSNLYSAMRHHKSN
ncbi:spermidine synthase [Leptolyngbya sp. AN03gr2]|uniref:spermidine synthase n=1 Tax=unclassified Leptolyngbya TaxID=2650499 RepID=UPI003D322347